MGPETAVSAQKGTFRGSGSGLLSGDWSTYDQSQLPQGTTGGDDRTDELWAGGWNLAQFTGFCGWWGLVVRCCSRGALIHD